MIRPAPAALLAPAAAEAAPGAVGRRAPALSRPPGGCAVEGGARGSPPAGTFGPSRLLSGAAARAPALDRLGGARIDAGPGR